MSSQCSNNTESRGRLRFVRGCITCAVDGTIELQREAQRAIRGSSSLICQGDDEHNFADEPRRNQHRDNRQAYITLVAKQELPLLCNHYRTSSADQAAARALESAENELFQQDNAADPLLLLDLGVAACDDQCFHRVAVCWPDATIWRARHGLPRRDFHVALGFRFPDLPSVAKEHRTLPVHRDENYCDGIDTNRFEATIQTILKHLQTNKQYSDSLEHVIDMLLCHAKEGRDGIDSRKQVLALKALCKLRSNQRRFEDVIAIADQILFLADCHIKTNSVRALRALALLQIGKLAQALQALEETVALMDKNKSGPKRIELLRAAVQCRSYLGMNDPFVKFPRTAHLFDAGGKAVARDDLLVPDLGFFLDGNKEILVEEKVDGANMGFSISSTGQIFCQNRSHYVTASSQAQFQKLPLWLNQHGDALRNILEPGRHILFGEWCSMVHSLQYTRLPGLFLAFDRYDKFTGTFASRRELHTLLQPTGIPVVPIIDKLRFDSEKALLPLLDTKSRFGDFPVEGVYLRYETEGQEARHCKLVRPDFVSGMELHWSSQMQKKNLVCQEMAQIYDAYSEAAQDSDKFEHEDVDDDDSNDQAGGATAAGERITTNDNLFDPRSRVDVNLSDGRQVRLMRNFSFLIPDQLAISSTPKRQDQIEALRQLGISLIVTLTEEEPLDESWFAETNGIENWFVPVANCEPPTVDQMDQICRRIQQTIVRGGCVLEHCGGGKGRAGTVAACLLVRFGLSIPTDGYVNNTGANMSSKEAIEYVRSARPGSLETIQQERFVQKYTQHVWKELELGDSVQYKTEERVREDVEQSPTVAAEASTLPLEDSKPSSGAAKTPTRKEMRAMKELVKQQKSLQKRAPDVVMLIGIPGSGKSTFATQLENASGGGWKRISQDEMGRQQCEDWAGRYAGKSGNHKVVLDRCNVQAAERRHWLDLMFVLPSTTNGSNATANHRGAAAVYFDVPLSTCLERVRGRTNHPTLRGGGTAGSEKIVRDFSDRLEAPQLREGFGKIHLIRTPEDAQKLLRSWGVFPVAC